MVESDAREQKVGEHATEDSPRWARGRRPAADAVSDSNSLLVVMTAIGWLRAPAGAARARSNAPACGTPAQRWRRFSSPRRPRPAVASPTIAPR